ncbi:NHL repeat-containing protein [Novosphingobium beihaiensis]|uniref:NHL repeat-containing protein n=1 Tax=Novosphingobium beihaiensis TaxID=2930389 RepID=A0ABT0BMF3_9SPHN|nr:hypothetical protein [Novosphingobium beihaiensis]MCJ2185894.1 hypothetical protein [Novosphingobium beihaiensis]
MSEQMFRNVLSWLALAGAGFAAPAGAESLVRIESEHLAPDVPMPLFQADAEWPRLPADTILGQVPGLSVDGEDRVWIVQRPNSLNQHEAGLAQDPPTTQGCCRPAPHVMRFSADGQLLAAWGGPELAPSRNGETQWPSNVHGIFAAQDGTVWIGGNGKGDHVVLNFTAEGQYLRQIGKRGRTAGNLSRDSLGNPADISQTGGKVLVADGYINKRIVAFDAADLSFERTWGAYGGTPGASVRAQPFDQSQAASTRDGGADPQAREFGDIVHCVERGPDALIYVCDRRNNRIQVFRDEGEKLEFVRDIVIAPETGGLRTASDVAFSPDGQFLYVADMANGKVWVLLRESDRVIGSFGRNGRYPGQFIWLHSVETDSLGNVYTSEVGTGRRVQKFVLTGMSE